MSVTLYWMAISHPCQAARKMLDLKGVDYNVVNVMPLNQRLHLRVAGFHSGTVPALKIDGQRVQGSKWIARALDLRWPDPPMFPRDSEKRAPVEEAERWGERELQPIPRRLARFGAAHDMALRRWALEAQPIPGGELLARVIGPLINYYARTVETDGRRADEEGVRADLAALPGLLDRADALVGDGTLAIDPPNAASLQILSSVRALAAFSDLRELTAGRPCVAAAREVGFRPRELPTVPGFLTRGWLVGIAGS